MGQAAKKIEQDPFANMSPEENAAWSEVESQTDPDAWADMNVEQKEFHVQDYIKAKRFYEADKKAIFMGEGAAEHFGGMMTTDYAATAFMHAAIIFTSADAKSAFEKAAGRCDLHDLGLEICGVWNGDQAKIDSIVSHADALVIMDNDLKIDDPAMQDKIIRHETGGQPMSPRLNLALVSRMTDQGTPPKKNDSWIDFVRQAISPRGI